MLPARVITYDLEHGTTGPAHGDVLVTGKGHRYLVDESRPVVRRTPGPPRFRLSCWRADPDEFGVNVFTLKWKGRVGQQAALGEGKSRGRSLRRRGPLARLV